MSSTLRWRGGLILIGAFASCTARAGADAPPLWIQWSVNDGAVNLVQPPGQPAGDSFVYEGVATDPATGLELPYSFSGNAMSALGGNVQIDNELSDAITVNMDVRLSFVPDLPVETQLAGQCTIGITTGADGGQIASLPPALFQTLVDGESAGFDTTLFWHEFFMGSSGQGNASTFAYYGVPQPVPGPPLLSSLGYALHFQLTPQDLGSITVDLTANGQQTLCAEDLDGNGQVNSQDLLELAVQWGPCGKGCPADLDGSNDVGVFDMLMVLQAWGPCGG